MSNILHFWSAWLRGPHRVGAVAPSSPVLARAMVDTIDDDQDGLIVELGAGTGAISHFLAQRFERQRLILLERDAHLAQHLRQKLPDHKILTDDARQLLDIVEQRPVCAVVSGLPLLSLPREDRSDIVQAVAGAIGDTGQLVQFTYGLGAPVPAQEAQRHQLMGERRRYVVWNLPPATVWNYSHRPH